jgi:hypothetical protein
VYHILESSYVLASIISKRRHQHTERLHFPLLIPELATICPPSKQVNSTNTLACNHSFNDADSMLPYQTSIIIT